MNQQFVEPLSESEVVRATKSAEKAWKAKNDAEANLVAKERGYPGAGYNVTNAKLIEWLEITDDEQRQLETIIGRDEKQRRDTESTRMARRKEGVLPRHEYEAQAKKRRQEVFRMRSDGMSHQAIANTIGVSKRHVTRILSSKS